VYQYLSIDHDITERKKAEQLIIEQSEIFEAIIENTKESIFLLSPDFKVIQFNKTAKERIWAGRGVELYKGIDFREFLYPDAIELFYSMFNDALNGLSRKEEVCAKTIDGNTIWFLTKTSPVYNRDGQLIGLTILSEGINERKKQKRYCWKVSKSSEVSLSKVW